MEEPIRHVMLRNDGLQREGGARDDGRAGRDVDRVDLKAGAVGWTQPRGNVAGKTPWRGHRPMAYVRCLTLDGVRADDARKERARKRERRVTRRGRASGRGGRSGGNRRHGPPGRVHETGRAPVRRVACSTAPAESPAEKPDAAHEPIAADTAPRLHGCGWLERSVCATMDAREPLRRDERWPTPHRR